MDDKYDLVCLSHLRWSFVFQRPQHLLTRCARDRRVFFVEEPIFSSAPSRLELTLSAEGVYVAVPWIDEATPPGEIEAVQAECSKHSSATKT